ncbi:MULTISPECIES: RNA polymerase sigma factor [unclassified Breznakia]|uniref:RNA polymerase sigma factor n=1 Tax=unclassified Breznakia TaxID=2623764 RepID=UPI002404FE6C|nr:MULTISPECIES: RNA polymerase sigma factor [unclassified Breznakia]MDF9838804.1 RNA polymerase sigma factor (sigma-70 family) [Breznakia sp. PFB2-8]MDF9860827.1 RNA polymerase sigma factor (sigma-70 family) [Breznakia sp. PH5-24]
MKTKKIENETVKRLMEGDQKAFEKIYAHYESTIYYFAVSYLKNSADAEEVVQETFIKVYTKIHTLNNFSAFHSWLFSVAYRQIIEILRKNSRTLKQTYSDDGIIDTLENKENSATLFNRNEIWNTIATEFAKMPTNYEQIAKLKYFDDLSVKEIAEVMQMPEGTVKTRLKIVRDMIKPDLYKKGLTTKNMNIVFPLMYFQFFSYMVENISMPADKSKFIFGLITEKALPSSAKMGIVSITEKIGRALLALGVFSTAGILYYNYTNQSEDISLMLETITYDTALTNQDVIVYAYFNQPVARQQVKIKNKDGESLNIRDKKENYISFIVNENGTYIVSTEEDYKTIKITNIYRDEPKLENIKYKNNVLTFDIIDDIKIDYEKSYYVHDQKKESLSNDHQIKGPFNGILELYVYNIAGNYERYVINID